MHTLHSKPLPHCHRHHTSHSDVLCAAPFQHCHHRSAKSFNAECVALKETAKEVKTGMRCGEGNCMAEGSKDRAQANEKVAKSAAVTVVPKSHSPPRRNISERFPGITAAFASGEWYELSFAIRTNFHKGEPLRSKQTSLMRQKSGWVVQFPGRSGQQGY